MVGLDEALVDPIVYGNAFGLGSSENITLLGDPITRFEVPDFKVNRSKASTTSRERSRSTSLCITTSPRVP